MDKKLKAHDKFMNNATRSLEKDFSEANSEKRQKIQSQAKRLYAYHNDQIRNFQHERLIHLIVTVFFACLTILSAGIFIYVASLSTSYSLFMILLFSIFIILIITEMFYVAHYYKLENGTQKLYEYSNRLEKIIES